MSDKCYLFDRSSMFDRCSIFDSVINASILHKCLCGQLNPASGAQENGDAGDQKASSPLLSFPLRAGFGVSPWFVPMLNHPWFGS